MPRKGQKLTPEQRKKISESRKNLTPEQRERIAAAQRNKKVSEETRRKMSAAHMGHSVSEKARAAIGNAHRGKIVSNESKELNRQKHIGNVASDETREKMRLTHLGKNNPFFGREHSEETKQKMHQPRTDETKANLSAAKKGKMPANIELLKVSRIGSTNSEEHRRIVSEALTGIVRSEETNELNRLVHTGLVQSEEARQKNMLAHIGEKNHAWKGGVTVFNESIRSSAKYLAWRDAVYKRDDYCDVITGERGNGNLNAHHITPFAYLIERNHITTFEEAMACEELWDVSNGITMIEANHILYHARTGKPE
jgi:5-methylcytosine-specific restriction endonuclease McrA